MCSIRSRKPYLVAGNYHSCALISGSGVKCWGQNSSGQVGDDSTTTRNTAVNVYNLTSGVTTIAAGAEHTCAITSGGGLKCWGLNYHHQLAVNDGSNANRKRPVDVYGLSSGVTAVAPGTVHTCAIVNGGAKCWGYNTNGQLGDNSTTNRTTPVDVSGLTSGVSAMDAGYLHTCAVVIGGAKCWGAYSYGQLGGTYSSVQKTPVNVSGLSNGVTGIGSGDYYNCALLDTGAIKCWGWNNFGALGDGLVASQSATPVHVKVWDVGTSAYVNLTGATAVTAGGYHNCAVVYTGAMCWGLNNYGGVGDGTTTQRNTAVEVSGMELPPTPTGAIESPRTGDTFGQATVNFEATADVNGGPAIEEVRFYVKYDGSWHNIGADTTATTVSGEDYYSVAWATPKTLATQTITFSVHIENTAGRIAVDAGGVKAVNYVATVLNPNINSAWEPSGAYLNQVEAQPGGDPFYWGTEDAPWYNVCNGSSAAMMLGLTGYIAPTTTVMSDTARALWDFSKQSGFAASKIVEGINTDTVVNSEATACYQAYGGTTATAWNVITSTITSGRPLMTGTLLTGEGGHYIVIVGFNESNGGKQIIAYDPMGEWQGPSYSTTAYDANSEAPGQVKGRWVYYDFTDTYAFDPSSRVFITLALP